MSWCHTHPQIDTERQAFLASRCAVVAHIESGTYPFRDVKLSRSDVEWLLATHEDRLDRVATCNRCRQVDVGLDLRGALLQQVNLSALPLANLLGGRSWLVYSASTEEQCDHAGVHFEGADLGNARLEGSFLGGAHLEECFLGGAHLAGVYLEGAHLEGASLEGAHLEGAHLAGAHLEGANLAGAHLEGAHLAGAHLAGAHLAGAHLEGANLAGALLSGRTIPAGFLKRVRHWDTDVLTPANLQGAYFDSATILEDVVLGDEQFGFVSLADLHWGGANLSVVEWDAVTMLGDERRARQTAWLFHYQAAVRAYRQLAAALREQGMHEMTVRFAYRAHVLQRRVLWRQMLQLRRRGRIVRWRLAATMARYLCSWLLDLFAGYGYKPMRSLVAYALVIGAFMTLYYVQGAAYVPRVSWAQSFIVSMTAFHGRAFLPVQLRLAGPQAFTGAIESFVGLVFEIGLILILARRFLRSE